MAEYLGEGYGGPPELKNTISAETEGPGLLPPACGE